MGALNSFELVDFNISYKCPEKYHNNDICVTIMMRKSTQENKNVIK